MYQDKTLENITSPASCKWGLVHNPVTEEMFHKHHIILQYCPIASIGGCHWLGGAREVWPRRMSSILSACCLFLTSCILFLCCSVQEKNGKVFLLSYPVLLTATWCHCQSWWGGPLFFLTSAFLPPLLPLMTVAMLDSEEERSEHYLSPLLLAYDAMTAAASWWWEEEMLGAQHSLSITGMLDARGKWSRQVFFSLLFQLIMP